MDHPTVPVAGPLVPARFLERPNRFVVRCRLEDRGDVVEAHLADRGRLEAVLVPGRRLWLRPAADPTRRTAWSALLAESPAGVGLVSLDTTLPNRLVARALQVGALDEFDGWTLEKVEWSRGPSRFDFLLGRSRTGTRAAPYTDTDGAASRLVLEVKSVGLVEGGVAYFPDGVTARGTRHLRELAEIAGEEGWAAAVLFVVQREDAQRVRAAARIDPEFAKALDEARAAGVRVLARRCHVALDGVTLARPLPVD
jgi:sugar fermentation stimulation protein A